MVHLPFAYIGPGAGFAFLGSFFSILLSLLAGVASLLLWPFRAILRVFRPGRNFRARVILIGIDGVAPGGWSAAGFWRTLSEHGVDSTVLLVPVTFPEGGFKGRGLWRTRGGEIVSQPSYYVKYLARLLGQFSTTGITPAEQEALFFSALDHQKRGVLACVFDMPREDVERIAGRLLQSLDPDTTAFIVSGQSSIVSNRALEADVTTDDIAPAVLRIFGIPVVRFA